MFSECINFKVWLSTQATRPEYAIQIAKVGLCKFVVEGLKC